MGEVRLDLTGLDLASKAVDSALKKTVRAVAFAVQEQATENVREQDAIDTGALLNSIYVETSEEHQREAALAAAMAAAHGLRGKQGRKARRHVRVIETFQAAMPPPPIEDAYQARVASCVEHGAYVEMGVIGSATGDHDARPFLQPAAVVVQPKANGILATILKEELGG